MLASSYAGCEADPGLCMATENGGVSSTFTGVCLHLQPHCIYMCVCGEREREREREREGESTIVTLFYLFGPAIACMGFRTSRPQT